MALLAGSPALADLAPDRARARLVSTANSWLPGDRIRVVSPEPYRVHTAGWFHSLEGDSVLRMRVSRNEPPLPVRIHQIGALEEKVGTKRHWRAGATVGLVVGLLVGLAVADNCEEEEIVIPGLTTMRTRGRAVRLEDLARRGMRPCGQRWSA